MKVVRGGVGDGRKKEGGGKRRYNINQTLFDECLRSESEVVDPGHVDGPPHVSADGMLIYNDWLLVIWT